MHIAFYANAGRTLFYSQTKTVKSNIATFIANETHFIHIHNAPGGLIYFVLLGVAVSLKLYFKSLSIFLLEMFH